MFPVKIDVQEKKTLHIIWDDKTESLIPLAVLRRNCPCAYCVTERLNRLPSYIPLMSTAQRTLRDIKPVGTYAIQLYWQDDHDDGIYNYEFLKELEKKE
ncbi:MAG: DUF971 domain-containing protein [Ignavibacteriae bacterium]|nr:MAG: DUF971 domain-containing protein [Ignavibacteriota bacterium]